MPEALELVRQALTARDSYLSFWKLPAWTPFRQQSRGRRAARERGVRAAERRAERCPARPLDLPDPPDPLDHSDLLDHRPQPMTSVAPGRLIDVGGHRLHLHCLGAGTPPVILDAALGASSLSWSLVQPAVSAVTQCCAYDRAGFGWSDAGPLPRTADRIADELRLLLQHAAVSGSVRAGRPLVRRPRCASLRRAPSRSRCRNRAHRARHPGGLDRSISRPPSPDRPGRASLPLRRAGPPGSVSLGS